MFFFRIGAQWGKRVGYILGKGSSQSFSLEFISSYIEGDTKSVEKKQRWEGENS